MLREETALNLGLAIRYSGAGRSSQIAAEHAAVGRWRRLCMGQAPAITPCMALPEEN